jgi:hypothetical protein
VHSSTVPILPALLAFQLVLVEEVLLSVALVLSVAVFAALEEVLLSVALVLSVAVFAALEEALLSVAALPQFEQIIL